QTPGIFFVSLSILHQASRFCKLVGLTGDDETILSLLLKLDTIHGLYPVAQDIIFMEYDSLSRCLGGEMCVDSLFFHRSSPSIHYCVLIHTPFDPGCLELGNLHYIQLGLIKNGCLKPQHYLQKSH
ncbi:hypothetical protein Ccrd_005962, partial [Cynara cardunculus var. scolymus]